MISDPGYPRTIRYAPMCWGQEEEVNGSRGDQYVHARTFYDEKNAADARRHIAHQAEISTLNAEIERLRGEVSRLQALIPAPEEQQYFY